MKINKKTYALGTLAILATLIGSTSAFAETNTPQGTQENNQGNHFGQIRKGNINGMMKSNIIGQVTAISGNTITITSKKGYDRKNNTTTGTVTTTTFTIDATNAKIEKGGTTGTISSIIIGDTIIVQGTINGTNVVATNIRDGILRGQDQNNGNDNKNNNGQQIPVSMQGNGLPIVAGSVISITGNNIVITNKSNVTYTIDATNAKIIKDQTTGTITNVIVGDQIIAQGTINGNSMSATSIYDQTKPTTNTPKNKGIFSRIGSFFGSLFGF